MPWPEAPDIEPGDVISILGVDHVFCEGAMRTGGSLSWNNRNPGNIVRSDEATRYGAFPGKQNHNFAVFPSDDSGFEAIRRYLGNRRDKTVVEVMKAYAPAGHGANDPQRYAEQVANALGVSPDAALAGMDDGRLTAFATAIRQVEGWRPGQECGPGGLPGDVVRWLADHPSRAEREAADQPFARRGTIAPGVRNIQQRLNDMGFQPALIVDGVFGPHTEEAVRWLQSSHGLAADGIVGSKTWLRLTGG